MDLISGNIDADLSLTGDSNFFFFYQKCICPRLIFISLYFIIWTLTMHWILYSTLCLYLSRFEIYLFLSYLVSFWLDCKISVISDVMYGQWMHKKWDKCIRRVSCINSESSTKQPKDNIYLKHFLQMLMNWGQIWPLSYVVL